MLIPGNHRSLLFKFDELLAYDESKMNTLEDIVNHMEKMSTTIKSNVLIRVFKIMGLRLFQKKLPFKLKKNNHSTTETHFYDYIIKLATLMKNIFGFLEFKVNHFLFKSIVLGRSPFIGAASEEEGQRGL